MEPVKVVLCGPPGTGKSCLREGLKRAILAKNLESPYPYCIPANPDGDGAWFLPTAWNYPDEAQRYRELIKKKFSDAFADQAAKFVDNIRLPLVLVDIGGKPLPDNEGICRSATHAVILGKVPDDFRPWREFCSRTGKDGKLQIIAEITSAYNDARDQILSLPSDAVLKGTVHRLDRGESAEGREMVGALADHVLKITNSKLRAEPSRDTSAFLVTPSSSIDDMVVFSVGFGRAAIGPEIVRSALQEFEAARRDLGSAYKVALFDGPASVAGAGALGWRAAQYFPAVGFFDPLSDSFILTHVRAGLEAEFPHWSPGAVIKIGPGLTGQPRRWTSKQEATAVYRVRAMERLADATRFDIGVGDTPAPTAELVASALLQLSSTGAAQTAGALFDGRVPVTAAAALANAAVELGFHWVAFLDPTIKRYIVVAGVGKAPGSLV